MSEESEEAEDAASMRPLLASTPVAYARSGQDPYRLDGVASHTRATSDGQSFISPPAQHDPIAQTPPPQTQTQIPPAPPVSAEPTAIVHTSSAPPPVQHEISSQQPDVSPLQPEAATPAAVPNNPIPSGPDDRPMSNYGDWMAPAAAGVAGVGAGAVGAEVYHHQQHEPFPSYEQQDEGIQTDPTIDTTVASSFPVKHDDDALLNVGQSASSVSPVTPVSGMTDDTEATEVTDLATPLASESNKFELGGLEKEGARETGRAIPVIRHRSDMSVSGLHIPGAFGRE